jgi:hypothetical protein
MKIKTKFDLIHRPGTLNITIPGGTILDVIKCTSNIIRVYHIGDYKNENNGTTETQTYTVHFQDRTFDLCHTYVTRIEWGKGYLDAILSVTLGRTLTETTHILHVAETIMDCEGTLTMLGLCAMKEKLTSTIYSWYPELKQVEKHINDLDAFCGVYGNEFGVKLWMKFIHLKYPNMQETYYLWKVGYSGLVNKVVS